MKSTVHADRLERCGQLMEQAGLDAVLLTKPANMFYLAGDGRLCAYMIVTCGGEVALGVPKTDTEDVERLARFDFLTGFDDEVGMLHGIAHDFERFGIGQGTVGLEYTFLTKSMMSMLTHPHAKPANVAVEDATPVLSKLRMIKEPGEIERIRRAAGIAQLGMMAALEAVRAGVTESEIAAEAEYAMRRAGAEGFWRSYVASGKRTGIAHGLPSLRKLLAGDPVMIDIHPICDGYSADMCRMAFVSEPLPEQATALNLFQGAQNETISACRAGVSMSALESTLHGVIEAGGFGKHVFGPPIHGVGIEFEEPPLPAGHAFFHGEKEPPPLEANVVLAVGNCGLYMNGWGVRQEDTVVVGSEGPEILTRSATA